MRVYKSVLVAALAAIAVAVVPGSALAQDPCTEQDFPKVAPWDPKAPQTRLVRLNLADCLGGKPDPHPLTKRVREAAAVKDHSDSLSLRPTTDRALALLIEHLTTPIDGMPSELRAELRTQIALARATLGSGVAPAVIPTWEVDNISGTIAVSSLPPVIGLEQSCATPAPSCAELYLTTREVWRVAGLVRAVLSVSESEVIARHLQETSRRLQMWNTYFETARSQYLWELAVNGAVMRETRDLDSNGIRRGFRVVPNSQIMLLHPTVALEYADGEPEGNRFAAVAVLDLVGYNRWSWKDDGAMGFAIGASAILMAGDHANLDDAGLGAMLHLNHRFSVGMTFLGKNRTVLVSGDVAQVWTRISGLRKRKMMTGQ